MPAKTPIQQCFATMDGAVYHGDPTDRAQMKKDVAACESGISAIQRMRPTAAQGPEKLYLTGRILDRAATLSYMGLDDTSTALREVRTANLYFRIAAGLASQSADYRAAAWANVKLTQLQLNTLHAEIAARASGRRAVVAMHARHAHGRTPARSVPAAYTAYHRL